MNDIKKHITGSQLNELSLSGRNILWKWYEKQAWYPVAAEDSVLLSLSVSNKGRNYPLLTNDQMKEFLKDINSQKPLRLDKGQWLYTEAWLDSVDKKNWCDKLWERVKEEVST